LGKVGFVFDEKWTMAVRGMVEGLKGWEGKVPVFWSLDTPEGVGRKVELQQHSLESRSVEALMGCFPVLHM